MMRGRGDGGASVVLESMRDGGGREGWYEMDSGDQRG